MNFKNLVKFVFFRI